MSKTLHAIIALTLVFVAWVYKSFFQVLLLELGSGFSTSYDRVIRLVNSFDYIDHAVVQISKLGFRTEATKIMAEISSYILLIFPFAAVYMLFILLRFIIRSQVIKSRHSYSSRSIYLQDGTLNPNRRNIDRLSEQHPWSRSDKAIRKQVKSAPSIFKWVLVTALTLLAIVSIYQCNYSNTDALSTGFDKRAVEILRGPITHVRDGDTFEVKGVPIRIAVLNCPENNTSEGKAATRFAKQFKGKQAICELTGKKTYDRKVGYCSIEGKPFEEIMVENTTCEYWCKYDVWNRFCSRFLPK